MNNWSKPIISITKLVKLFYISMKILRYLFNNDTHTCYLGADTITKLAYIKCCGICVPSISTLMLFPCPFTGYIWHNTFILQNHNSETEFRFYWQYDIYGHSVHEDGWFMISKHHMRENKWDKITGNSKDR